MSDGLWFRLNGNFAEHPKVMDLSDRAFRLHVAALCHTTRNLTDGFLSDLSVKVACALTMATRRHVVELRDAGLWIPLEEGWEIKDYSVYNPPAADLKELSDKRREAGRKGGLRSAANRQANRQASASSKTVATAAKHTTQQDVEPKAVRGRADIIVVELEQPRDFDIHQVLTREMPA